MPLLLQLRDRDAVTQIRVPVSLECRLASSQRGRGKGQTLTILVAAALRVEGFPPHDDLLCDDPVAVHVPFLRDAGLAEVLWGCPQVWAFSMEIAKLRG